jgi:RNA polymerase sigma factor (sigma-70 family)
MGSSEQQRDSEADSRGRFALTRWSVVLAVGASETTRARNALEELCRVYWQPIYAFVRREGHSPHDAQDLTQEFFARLLEKNSLAGLSPEKGRFRSFLLASVKHFLANEWDKARAQKRGGGARFLAIDAHSVETSCARELVENLAPDKVFERRWALALLQQVMTKLREEYTREGAATQFEALKTTLTGERRSVPYAEIASRLRTTEGAVKVAVYRLRQRYRALLREEIAQTVSGPEEVEDELKALFNALGS